jgi:hypothetical protein
MAHFPRHFMLNPVTQDNGVKTCYRCVCYTWISMINVIWPFITYITKWVFSFRHHIKWQHSCNLNIRLSFIHYMLIFIVIGNGFCSLPFSITFPWCVICRRMSYNPYKLNWHCIIWKARRRPTTPRGYVRLVMHRYGDLPIFWIDHSVRFQLEIHKWQLDLLPRKSIPTMSWEWPIMH